MSMDSSRPVGLTEVIVFASAFEEATCSASVCEFDFLDADRLPTVVSATTSFEKATDKHIITISGNDITDTDVNSVQVFIGGIEQTVRSVSATQVIVQVDDVLHGLTADSLEIYFSSGAPNGYSDIYSGVTFTPKFHGLEIAQGSEGGSTFNAIVPGVGSQDSVTLVDASNGNDLCESSEMISYGVL